MALDQPGGRRSLNDHILAGAAGIFGPAHDDHTQLRRHDVEPLAHIFADAMQAIAAARTGMVLDVDDHLHARQMGWQRAPVRSALCDTRLTFARSGPCLLFLTGRLDLFGFLKPQQKLVFGQRLSTTAEAVALQFLDDLD